MNFHLGDRMKSDTSLPINGVRVVLLFSMQQEAEVSPLWNLLLLFGKINLHAWSSLNLFLLQVLLTMMVLAQLEHFV